MTFLHPFDDHAVINGQGTIGLELLQQVQDLQAVVVPVGGGGLISGVACALKESNPAIRVVGVQTERLPSMLRAVDQGGPVTLPAEATIADGIAVRRAGDLTLPQVQRFVDEIVTVDEEEIANAIMVLLEKEKTLAEGAGAVALAALLQKKTSLQGARTAVLVCGGNIDVSLLSKIIERGLVKDGRRVRVRVHLADRPGALHHLTKILTDQRANIVEMIHNRAYYGVNLGDTVIDITLETRGATHITQISDALWPPATGSSVSNNDRNKTMQEFLRLKRLPPYVFNITGEMKAAARARGEDIIDFGMGNPDGATPKHIVDKMVEAVGKTATHRYSLSKGIPRLRKAICNWYKKRYDVDLDPLTEAIVTIGSKEGIAHLCLATLDRGDVVAGAESELSHPYLWSGYRRGKCGRPSRSRVRMSFWRSWSRRFRRCIPGRRC